MPLMPKRVKYRKTQRGSRKGTASRNLRIDFGEFGLQTLEPGKISAATIPVPKVCPTMRLRLNSAAAVGPCSGFTSRVA